MENDAVVFDVELTNVIPTVSDDGIIRFPDV
jgi:hypothetical protein